MANRVRDNRNRLPPLDLGSNPILVVEFVGRIQQKEESHMGGGETLRGCCATMAIVIVAAMAMAGWRVDKWDGVDASMTMISLTMTKTMSNI